MNLADDWPHQRSLTKWQKNGILNQKKKLSAHVWKSCAACTYKEDDKKQTKTTGWDTVQSWVGIKDLEMCQSKM